MTRVVESVAVDYSDCLRWEKVITKTLEGPDAINSFLKHWADRRPCPPFLSTASWSSIALPARRVEGLPERNNSISLIAREPSGYFSIPILARTPFSK